MIAKEFRSGLSGSNIFTHVTEKLPNAAQSTRAPWCASPTNCLPWIGSRPRDLPVLWSNCRQAHMHDDAIDDDSGLARDASYFPVLSRGAD